MLEARDRVEAEEAVTSTPSDGEKKPAAGASAARPAPLQARDQTPCERACQALDSMRRSAEGICRLAGEETTRCDRAQSRVVTAEELVDGAGCDCLE